MGQGSQDVLSKNMIKGIHQYVNGFSCDQKSVGQNPKGNGFLFLKEGVPYKKVDFKGLFLNGI